MMISNKLLILRDSKNYFCLPLIFIVSLFILSCSREAETDVKQEYPSETPSDVKSYERNGLSMTYPANWEFLYDNEPDMYASRSVGFQISEFSNVRALIDHTNSLKLSAIADRFEKELQLKSSKIADDYVRKPTVFGKYKGEKLSWVDKSLNSTKFEMSILTISETPEPIFAVIHLSQEDIAQESQFIEFYLKSLSYKNTGTATNTDQ